MAGTGSVRTSKRPLLAGFCLVLAAAALSARSHAQGLPYALFEQYLESLREETAIPGLSAAIVRNGREAWSIGLGRQDVENAVAARADTPYLIGHLTQSLTAILLGQCIERVGLNVNQPVRRWTTAIPESSATVWHVLAHASSGVPGEVFRFDPGRYGTLAAVAEDCTRDSFRTAVAANIFDRLGMRDSVPGRDLQVIAGADDRFFDDARLRQYEDVVRRLAVPYRVERSGRATRSDYPADSVNGATGLVSTARDLARFEGAMDDNALIGGGLRSAAWTNVTTSTGAPLPVGLGWFVQSINGRRVVWQFGSLRDAGSSLVIKVPDRDITLVLLANSDGLAPGETLAAGDLNVSLFAKLFFRLFVS
jgi:CubicO group peptidase (beta-lactamase class C family)